jgi:hypothetical protein
MMTGAEASRDAARYLVQDDLRMMIDEAANQFAVESMRARRVYLCGRQATLANSILTGFQSPQLPIMRWMPSSAKSKP